MVEIRTAWIVNKKFGLRCKFTDLLVKEKDRGASNADYPELD